MYNISTYYNYVHIIYVRYINVWVMFFGIKFSSSPHGFTRIQCLLDALRVPDDELEAAIDACKAQLVGGSFCLVWDLLGGLEMVGFAYVEGDVLKSTGFFMLSRES